MTEEPDIVERLRNYNTCSDTDVDEAADEIERLRKERDEARRMYCRTITDLRDLFVEQYGADTTPQSVAKEYGWDCFHNSNNQENDNGKE